jgi:glucan-binding YG repeat protein
MVFPKIIEGYGNLGPGQYRYYVFNRVSAYGTLVSQLKTVTAERDKKQREYDSMNSYHSSDVSNLKNTKSERLRTLASLKTQIANLEREIATLEYYIKSTYATKNRKKNNVLIPAERKFVESKQVTDGKLDEILPLKKKENSSANNYFNLLMSQNEEVSTEIYKQKNNLTTADRKNLINDSKHPYYITLNKGLFILYIVIALYVIYNVLTGMITQNIYGKFIIILLISLYPLYILGLEQYIYNQYLLIKAMIRAEPYVPAK